MPLRLIFMGTPDFAVPTLVEIVGRGRAVVAVYTRAAKPAGRGMEPTPSPVERAARGLGLPVHTPATLRTPEALAAFKAHGFAAFLPKFNDAGRHASNGFRHNGADGLCIDGLSLGCSAGHKSADCVFDNATVLRAMAIHDSVAIAVSVLIESDSRDTVLVSIALVSHGFSKLRR